MGNVLLCINVSLPRVFCGQVLYCFGLTFDSIARFQTCARPRVLYFLMMQLLCVASLSTCKLTRTA